MSTVVVGVGASHSTLMNTHWDEAEDQDGAQHFRDGLDQAAAVLKTAEPDALVVVGANHFRGFFLDLMPAFTVGVGECSGLGESGTPKGPLPVDTDLARQVAWGLSERDFDIALSLRMEVDHGITHCLQYLVPEVDVPIVPIVINAFTPPLPSLRRCFALGQAIREVLEGDGQGKRVAVLASGGLSHHLPWPKWFDAMTDDERFLVEAFLEGRHAWEQYEERRRAIVRAAESQINEDFDREFLRILAERDWDAILSRSAEEIEALAGNGGQEIRNWIVAAAALGGAASTLAYAPMEDWITGMAVATIAPAPVSAAELEAIS
jgi:2,3-dihydroxyphenylpropionate 1,2-dioxygenase